MSKSKKKKQQQSGKQEQQRFSMLGFFRRYEKTFLLVLLAPALLSMGVTGVMIGVFQDQGEVSAGRLYGEPVSQQQFDEVANLYRRVVGYADDESAWQFFALLRAADNAGISVSDREVGDDIRTNFRWDILRYLAEKEVKERGVDIATEEGQRLFNTILFQKLDEAEFDEDVYREILEKRRGIDVRAYEEQQRRSAKVSRLLDSLREMAVVSPDEVWDEYQSKNHQRTVEYVALSAENHSPVSDESDPKSPHFISTEQVDEFYEDAALRGFYDEPRRVNLEYLSYSFNAAKLDLDEKFADLDDPDLEAFYLANRARSVAAIGSDLDFVDMADSDVDTLRELLMEDMALNRVDGVMNQVADLVQAANDAGVVADLGSIREEVQETSGTTGIVKASTGQIEADEATVHEDVGGAATRRWFLSINEEKRTSDVLAGEKAWFVLRSSDVREARRLSRQDVEENLRDDYVSGTRAEQKAHYDQNKHTKYMQAPAFQVEYVQTLDEDFEGDHDKAKASLQQALATAAGWPRGFRWGKFETDPGITDVSVIHIGEVEKIDRNELDEHELLGNAAGDISFSPRNALSSTVAESQDGKGWVIFRKVQDFPQQIQPFDEVQEAVAEALGLSRGLERAEGAAYETLDLLANKTGEALTSKLKELGLETAKTEAFSRNGTKLEGIEAASGLIGLAFSDSLLVDGPFEDSWLDSENERVLLLRVAEKLDAPRENYDSAFPTLRSELLTKVRGEFATEQSQRLLLDAKGIDEDHIDYATKLRAGPAGETQVSVRQIFLPPDPAIVDGWLEDQALAKIKEVQAELNDGKSSWGFVVSNHSEDEHTSADRGSLPPIGRGDLIESHGIDFVEAIFELGEKEVSAPVKSRQGYHLVMKWQTLDDGKVEFRHILIKTDPVARKLPDEVMKRAEEASRALMDQAWTRLQNGEPFVTVAEDVGDLRDPFARGAEFEMDYVTAFERAALAQVLEWEPAEDSAEANDSMWMPEPVELAGPDGVKGWHWFACERDRADQSSFYTGSQRRDRAVYHVVTKTRAEMDALREEMTHWLEAEVEKEEGARPGFPSIRNQFQDLARESSMAPDAGKGGAFGLVRLKDEIRPYGDVFLAKTSLQDDGKVVQDGYRTGVFQGEQGFHIVEVVEVQTKNADDRDRFAEIARVLMQGTDWE